MEQDTVRHRARRPWKELWQTGDDETYEDFLDRLPAFVRVKKRSTTLHYEPCGSRGGRSGRQLHEMRCIVTKCAS
ncbi:hypothetical protein GQ600_20223 [Phytophthora cactorum]|nr:hypothetical protein GQ600_20223 [Phytophthora cactorum]